MSNRLRALVERKQEIIERIRHISKLKKQTIKKSLIIVSEYNSGKLTKKTYQEKLNKDFKGKHPEDLIDYYNKYIEVYERHLSHTKGLINKENKKFKIKKIVIVSFTSIVFIALIYGIIYLQKPEPISLAPPTIKTYTQKIDITTTENITYDWILKNTGELQSVFLSGNLEGEGEAKVYLQDDSGNEYLILDSFNLGILFNPPENTTENNQTNQTEPPPTNETLTNETETNITTNETEIVPINITNVTEPETNITTNETIIPVNITIPFNEICEETCDLSPSNLNQTSYTLRIEVTDLTLNLNLITYDILRKTPPNETGQVTKKEEKTNSGKKIIITGPDGRTNVPISTEIPEEWNIKSDSSIKVYWEEQNEFIDFDSFDSNNDGKIDEIKWIIPHLSSQTFSIIIVTKAEHLDPNRNFISNIYTEISNLDNVWSEIIPSGDYIRVTFEENLTSDKDIKIYPRITSGNPKIEVYEFNQSTLIAEFTSLQNDQYNQVFLTNLIGSQDVFDLRIIGGSIEIDHIIDPQAEPGGERELNAQACFKQSEEVTQNNFPSLCDGTYPSSCPGDRLSCDDNTNEVATASKLGSTRTYGGFKIEVYNDSITNCGSIISVSLCYEFWGFNKQHQCIVGVDNDGDDSFFETQITECLSTTAPGLTCIDVTSAEGWTCDNFFGVSGTRATAKAQALRTGGNGLQVWNFDALFFNVTFTETGTNSPPIITFISDVNEVGDASPGVVDPVAGSIAIGTISFIADDPDGAADLDTTSGTVQFSLVPTTNVGTCSEAPTCDPSVCTGNQRNYTCSVDMNYYNDPGTWNVEVGVSDLATPTPNTATCGVGGSAACPTFTYTSTTGIDTSGSVNWASLGVTSTDIDQPADSPLTLFNRGNIVLTSIQIQSFDLPGTITATDIIPSETFSVGSVIGANTNDGEGACDGPNGGGLTGTDATEMLPDPNPPVTVVTTPALSIPYGPPGSDQDNLFFCIWDTLDTIGLSVQSYLASSPWVITPLVAPLILAKRKKKKEKKKKLLDFLDQNLEELIGLVKENKIKAKIENIKIPLEIFKQNISPAEAICKYLKENENLRFNEIALAINRDQRTVWINYRNAIKKKKEKLKILKELNRVPISIFQNRKLSILESTIKYLKDKDYKNSEISNVIGKNPNNIWTISKRTAKKLKNQKN